MDSPNSDKCTSVAKPAQKRSVFHAVIFFYAKITFPFQKAWLLALWNPAIFTCLVRDLPCSQRCQRQKSECPRERYISLIGMRLLISPFICAVWGKYASFVEVLQLRLLLLLIICSTKVPSESSSKSTTFWCTWWAMQACFKTAWANLNFWSWLGDPQGAQHWSLRSCMFRSADTVRLIAPLMVRCLTCPISLPRLGSCTQCSIAW